MEVVGVNYETHIKHILNNWLFEDHVIIQNLIEFLKIDKSQIFSIKSHSDIPLFDNRGKPKTDLVVEVLLSNGTSHQLKVSIKKTKKRKSSFHEYSVEEFIKVLKITNPSVIELLYKHQNDGSAKLMSEDEKNTLRNYFSNPENKLSLYNWVLMGVGGQGKDLQIANCILKNDKFYSIEDYIKEFLSSDCGFGTGFSWTRQSRGQGRTIQLKG